MSRNRMIKPEFWSSETLSSISLESRLIFIGIWNFCDDYGFCLNSARSLLGDLFPVDESVTESKLKGWIGELIKKKLLIPLSYNNKNLLFVRSWGEHQTVNNKSKRCHIELNDLEQVIKDTLDNNEALISIYLESHSPKRKKKEKEERESNKGSSTKKFIPPTLEEVIEYCESKKPDYNIDGRKFFDYYEAGDWKDKGGNQVLGWKQKAITWGNNACNSQNSGYFKNKSSNADEESYTDDELERIARMVKTG